MDCSGIADHLSPLLDGELESAEAEIVRAHLAECPRCRKSYNDHTNVKQLLSRKLLFKNTPPGLRSAILDGLGSSGMGDFFHTFLARLRAKPLVASGLAVLVLLAIWVSVLLLPTSHRFAPVLLGLLDNYAEASLAPLDVLSADAGHLAKKMSQSLNRNISVADLKGKWGFLVGARKCPICHKDAVEIRYLHPAGNFSHFMVLDAGKKAIAELCKSRELEEKRIDGAIYLYCEKACGRVIVWWEGDDIFVVRSGLRLPSFDIARDIRSLCCEDET